MPSIKIKIPYWPPIEWIVGHLQYDELICAPYDTYTKGTILNKTFIINSNGTQYLSVPVIKSKHPLMSTSRIVYYEKWQQNHWRSLQSAYGNAPYWEYYENAIKSIYSLKYKTILELNLAILDFINGSLKINWNIIIDPNSEPGPESSTNFPLKWTPEQGKDDYYYPQIFEYKHGFLKGHSIFDAIMCCGPKTLELLEVKG
jgi:hypothetical protein